MMDHIFREIAERIGVHPVREIIKKPGVKAVYRVTLHYHNLRTSDAIATVKSTIQGDATLDVHYIGRFNNQPLTRTLNRDDYDRFSAVFRNVKFDKLDDQQDIAPYGVDLCMMERGAGGFVKSVIFTPQQPAGVYASLLNAIHAYIPEALREI